MVTRPTATSDCERLAEPWLDARRAASDAIGLEVDGLPRIPGLRIRRYAGPSDHAGMAAANTAWRGSIGLHEHVSTEVLDNLYAHLTNSDPYRDCLVLAVEGTIAGYLRTEWLEEPGGDRVFETSVVLAPVVQGERAYAALLTHGERHLRAQHADRVGRAGDRFRAWIHDADEAQVAVHVAAGFERVHRWFEMLRPTLDDLPEAPMPAGLELRPVEPEHWRAIWQADLEAFSDDWDAPDLSETAFQRFLGEPDQVPELWQVAWDGDQVAGHVLVTIDAASNARFERRRAELDSVAVRAPGAGAASPARSSSARWPPCANTARRAPPSASTSTTPTRR